MERLALTILSSFSPEKLALLTDRQAIARNIYEVCKVDSDLAAIHPTDLPWFVELFLGSFSKKHVFPSRKTVGLQQVWKALREVEARIAWRWHFGKEEMKEERPEKKEQKKETREWKREAQKILKEGSLEKSEDFATI